MDKATQALLAQAGLGGSGGRGGAVLGAGRPPSPERRAALEAQRQANFMAPVTAMGDFFEFDPAGQRYMQLLQVLPATARFIGRSYTGSADAAAPYREVFPDGVFEASPGVRPQYAALAEDLGAGEMVQQFAQFVGEMAFDPTVGNEVRILGMLPDMIQQAKAGVPMVAEMLSEVANMGGNLGERVMAAMAAAGVIPIGRNLDRRPGLDLLGPMQGPLPEGVDSLPAPVMGIQGGMVGPASGGRYDAGRRGEDIWGGSDYRLTKLKGREGETRYNEPRNEAGNLIDANGNEILDADGLPIPAQDDVLLKDATGEVIGSFPNRDYSPRDNPESFSIGPTMIVRSDPVTGQEAVIDEATNTVASIGPALDSLSPNLRSFIENNQDVNVQRKFAKSKKRIAFLDNLSNTLLDNFFDSTPLARANMDRLTDIISRGNAMTQAAGRDWYDLRQIYDLALRAYNNNPDQADQWVRAMAIFTAVTSPNTAVSLNAKRALELMNAAFSGDDVDILVGLLRDNPRLASQIFGDSLAGVFRNESGIREALESGTIGGGQKITTFLSNFIGNANGVTVDTHNLAGILYAAGLDWREPAGRQAIAELLGYPRPTGENARISPTWEGMDPKSFRSWMYNRVSQEAEYGAFENLQRQLAQHFGLTPREFQANLWISLGDITGVRSVEPFSNIMMDQINRVARERGITPEEVVRLIGNGSLAVVGGVIPYSIYNQFMDRPSYYSEEDLEEEE